MELKVDLETFATALKSDKVHNYYDAFTNAEWEDILSIAVEHLDLEDREDEMDEAIMGAYEDGYANGYEEGHDEGDYYGYERGYDNGYGDGHADGLADGIEQASNNDV